MKGNIKVFESKTAILNHEKELEAFKKFSFAAAPYDLRTTPKEDSNFKSYEM